MFARARRPATPKTLTVNHQGFSHNAAVACTAQPSTARQRGKLERVARYIVRPAVALERLSVDHDGRVVLELKQPCRNGTTHMRFALAEWPWSGWLGWPRGCSDDARTSAAGAASRKRRHWTSQDASSATHPPRNDDGMPIARP